MDTSLYVPITIPPKWMNQSQRKAEDSELSRLKAFYLTWSLLKFYFVK